MARLGADVWVIGYGKKARKPFEQKGVKVFWLTLPWRFSRSLQYKGQPYSLATFIKRPYLSLQLKKLVNDQNFDLVESSDFNGPLYNKPPTKFIVRLEGAVTAYRHAEKRPDFIHPVDKYFESKQLLNADHIIACSNHIGELTNQAFGLNLPYELIYNAVNTDLFSPLSIEHKRGQILYVGNIMWRKGIFDLIRAMPLVIEKVPIAHLKIAGGAGNIHQKQLTAEISALPLEIQKKIEVIGHQIHNTLPSLYNESAVVVFPSRVEAFGLTCVEAMACARPVVATQMASGPELVEDGKSGLLANPEDPADLAFKIVAMLQNPTRALQMGQNARQRAIKMFSLADWGKRNLDYYKSILL